MTWPVVLAIPLSVACLGLATAFALWSVGVALPDGRRKALARHVSRTAGATSAPSPMMLGVLAAVFACAALLPWGLAAGPASAPATGLAGAPEAPTGGSFRFVLPALGLAYAVVFFTHGAGLGQNAAGATFARHDRRVFSPLALALAAGFLALTVAWFF